MSHGVTSPGRARIEQRTLRQDRWWLYPLVTFVVFVSFVVYGSAGPHVAIEPRKHGSRGEACQ